ncbi:F-box protein At3g07870-like [Papaver somniferum]|uniref:F-box protein At3g07870-like n=1 Tax=Papaver somniferum TaxID=3469 RepID=UPI000E6F8A8A|nr:F-box protein At3g07870-like [Papaver somniferum]
MKGRGGGRKRKRKANPELPDGESNSVIKFLPNEIFLDILYRLPIGSISECKQVCKKWCEKIRNPCFSKLVFKTPDDNKVSFLFLTLDDDSQLYHGSYSENREPCMEFTFTDHPPVTQNYSTSAMVGSCNGLVCISIPFTYNVFDPIYICNPYLGERVYLPRFTVKVKNKNNVEVKKTTYLDGNIVSGFGYTSVTDKHKVVRIYYAAGQSKGQVYTLGSRRGWRNIGEVSHSLLRHFDCPIVTLNHILDDSHDEFWKICSPCRGILASDALHWFNQEWEIVAFDLVKEEFSLLPPQPCPGATMENFLTLQVLEGRLCVASSHGGVRLDIFSFKKETSEWENMFSIACLSDQFMDIYWPISLTLSGKLLLRSNYQNLFCYDPQTGELKKQMDLDKGTYRGPSYHEYPKIEAIPHMNSFVSLKALGEKSHTISRDCSMLNLLIYF